MTMTRCKVMCARVKRVYLSVFCSEICTSLPGLVEVEYENSVIILSPSQSCYYLIEGHILL